MKKKKSFYETNYISEYEFELLRAVHFVFVSKLTAQPFDSAAINKVIEGIGRR